MAHAQKQQFCVSKYQNIRRINKPANPWQIRLIYYLSVHPGQLSSITNPSSTAPLPSDYHHDNPYINKLQKSESLKNNYKKNKL
jgi:hypothetical protein